MIVVQIALIAPSFHFALDWPRTGKTTFFLPPRDHHLSSVATFRLFGWFNFSEFVLLPLNAMPQISSWKRTFFSSFEVLWVENCEQLKLHSFCFSHRFSIINMFAIDDSARGPSFMGFLSWAAQVPRSRARAQINALIVLAIAWLLKGIAEKIKVCGFQFIITYCGFYKAAIILAGGSSKKQAPSLDCSAKFAIREVIKSLS